MLKKIEDESMKIVCATLENYLKDEDASNVDGLELFSILQLLRKSLPDNLTKPVEVLDYIKKYMSLF